MYLAPLLKKKIVKQLSIYYDVLQSDKEDNCFKLQKPQVTLQYLLILVISQSLDSGS